MRAKFIFLLVIFAGVCLASAYSDSVYVEYYDVEIEYDNAIADDVFSLKVTITNDASSEKNLTLDFDEDDPFEFVSDDEWNVLIGAGESESQTFRIEVDNDADSKKYDLEFNLDDGDDDWDEEFAIRVVSDAVELDLGEIVSSPAKILPGEDSVELEITVKNTGDYVAEDLVATLILPEGFEKSGSFSNKVHVGDLDAGEKETLTFYFDVDDYLSEDEYVADLRLEYDDEGSSESSTLDIELPVFGIAQFDITSVDVLSEGVYTGSTAKIKVGIQNVGAETGEDVSLKVYERSDQPFEFIEKSAYVGSLGVGQTGYAVFEFDVDRSASKIDYLLDFQVRSISGDDVLVDDLTAQVSVSEKKFNVEDYFLVGGIVIFAIIFVLVFLIARRL